MGFGIGVVIGTGIFTLTGIEAKNPAGPGVVISFAIAGVVALLAALCYAELASAVPTAGSAYSYAYATIGEICRLDHRLGPVPGVRPRRGGGRPRAGRATSAGRCSACRPSLLRRGARPSTSAPSPSCWCSASSRSSASASPPGSPTCWSSSRSRSACSSSSPAPSSSGAPTSRPSSRPSPVEAGTSGLKQPLGQALFGIEPSAFGFAGMLTAAAVVFFAYTGFEAVANLGEETRKPAARPAAGPARHARPLHGALHRRLASCSPGW